MLPEIEFSNRVKGINPSHEQLQHYATIFRASPNLAFAKAYVDGYYKAGCMYVPIIEQLISRINKYDT